jgi:hypothetical protein
MKLEDDVTTAEVWREGDESYQWRATLHEPRIVVRGGASSHDKAVEQVTLACRALAGDAGDFTELDAREYIASQEWVFARTMPQNPHEYVVLKASTRPHQHLAFRQFIRDRGVVSMFDGWEFCYLDIDHHRYWVTPTDPAPDGQSWTIINRKTVRARKD